MADIRWSVDNASIGVPTGTEKMPITNTSAQDKYVTPTAIRTYVLGDVTTTERDILDGATITTQELNLLDADSVAAVFMSGTSVQFKANSVLQVLVSDGLIVPNVDNTIDLGHGTFKYKDAYIAGTLDIRNIDASGDVDIDGTLAIGETLAYDTAAEVLAHGGTTEAAKEYARHSLDTTGGAQAFTIEDSLIDGQMKYLYMIADGGDATITMTKVIGTSITFDNIGDSCQLMWDAVQDSWIMVGGTAAWVA